MSFFFLKMCSVWLIPLTCYYARSKQSMFRVNREIPNLFLIGEIGLTTDPSNNYPRSPLDILKLFVR